MVETSLGYLLTPWLLVQVPCSSKLDSPSAPRLHLATLGVVHSSALLAVSKIHTQPYRPRSWQQVQMSRRSTGFEKHQTSSTARQGGHDATCTCPNHSSEAFLRSSKAAEGNETTVLAQPCREGSESCCGRWLSSSQGVTIIKSPPFASKGPTSVESTNTENI